MAYIGKEPIVGNFQVCDAISVVNGQAAYTMQVSSTNVVPESANHMLVSLNGILQKPNSSFTVSGSTITFASNLATGDVIDFIMLLGNVLDIGTPSDSTVTNAKTNFVSTSSAAGLQIKGDNTTGGTLQLNCEQNSHGIKLRSPAHSAGQSYTLTFPTGNVTAGKVLKVDSVSGSGTTGIGQLSFGAAGGITVADQFRVTADMTSNQDPVSSNIERIDTAGQGGITDSQMSVSSGIFTFPATGIYLVDAFGTGTINSSGDNISLMIYATTDNSNYNLVAASNDGTSGNGNTNCNCHSFIDVTDTSNVKVKFAVGSIASGSKFQGVTNYNQTCFTFIRLADT